MTLLGAFLKELRGTLSTLDVEREIGIPRITISRYERGENVPSSEKLQQLAAFYECPYEKLRILYYEDFLAANYKDWNILATLLVNKALEKEHSELWSAIKNLSPEQRVQFRNLALAHLEESEG